LIGLALRAGPARGVHAASVGLMLAACGARPPVESAAAGRVERCRYDVEVTRERPLLLDVRVACTGTVVRGLAAAAPETLTGLTGVTSGAGSLRRSGAWFELARPVRAASFRYRIDLDAVARGSDTADLALRRGDAMIAPVSTFLLHPLPLDTGTEVELSVTTPAGGRFVTGLERAGDRYRLEAHEIPVATYAVFGRFATRRVRVGSGGAELELALLGAELSAAADRLAEWARIRAEAVAAFYGEFPAARALVAAVPIDSRGRVRFGKLLPESAPGVVLLVGTRVTDEELAADWVLVHELFHIGVPSFYREGKWFDEGLATYFEPLVRARAGLLDEAAAFRDLRLGMPRGLSALTEDGLENTTSYSGIYWGGAIYCLLADAELRERSGGRVGLEDGLRRVRDRGGRSSEVWPLLETLQVADGAFTEPVLVRLKDRYAARPAALDLDALFEKLGVVLEGESVRLDDGAPLAWVRRSIVSGAPRPR
jgi:hypothetical protein